MRNRIRNVWDAIQNEELRQRVAHQEHAKALAAWALLPESQVSLRILGHPHPGDPAILIGRLVLFVGDLPALLVASGYVD